MVTVKELDEDLLYPSSDGKPMADNTLQYRWIVMIKENLEVLFGSRNDVFIAADLLWYPFPSPLIPESASEKRSLAPDVMVVFGRPKGDRKSYKQWQESNIPPEVVFEILSESNTTVEMEQKLQFYQKHGVQEYYIYNPETYVLKIMTRHQNQLVEIAEVNGWVSPRLGIKFDTSQGELVIYHPDGERFLTPLELSTEMKIQRQRAEQESQRAKQERQRAEQLAAYLRSLGVDPDNLPRS